MSLLAATQITAVATAVLALFAIVTAAFALLAFLKQSQELKIIREQAQDGRALIEQQRDMLDVQSGQLKIQQAQLDDQRELSAEQVKVLQLQEEDLRSSLQERLRAQASRVIVWQVVHPREEIKDYAWGTDAQDLTIELTPDDSTPQAIILLHVRNTSALPIYDVLLRWRSNSAIWSGPKHYPVILPGAEVQFPRLNNVPVGELDRHLFGALVEFRDAGDLKWRRHADGDLEMIESTASGR